MECYQYFRLDGPPFQPASSRGVVYFSPTHLQGLATLESGLSGELSGLTLLTGEAGTGKTTLIYSLLQRDYKRVRVAHIDDPKLSFLEIMQAVLSQLNLYCAGSTKLEYLNTLDHLLELHGKKERIAVVVDEAQLMSNDVLEDLRLLSNRAQLQLILVGQPELAERLKRPELRQLNQRISSRGVLKPLTPEQAHMYVECRLSVRGGKCSEIFEPGALNHLLRSSDGLPRKINMLCSSAMLASFDALERKISIKTAKKTAAEYGKEVGVTDRGFGKRTPLIPTLAAASLVLLTFVYRNSLADWVLDHTVSASLSTEQPVPPIKTVLSVKTVQPIKTIEQTDVGSHSGSGSAKTIDATTSPTLHAVAELRPSAAIPAVVASPKSPVADAAPASERRTVPNATVAIAQKSAGIQKAGIQKQLIGPTEPARRSQIIVRHGDTLEKIAIHYYGSTARINELVAANPQLTDINQLSVGEIIYLSPGITRKASHDQIATARPVPNVEDSPER